MPILTELLSGRRPQIGAPWVREFGNLAMWEIMLPRKRTSTLTDSGRGESQGSPTGVENAIFSWREIARCVWATGVFPRGKSLDHRCFWKRGFVRSLSLFSKTIVRQYWSFKLEKKHLISINRKKEFKRILSYLFGGRQRVQNLLNLLLF